MPYLSFASNFTWVMVIGLLGPSIPGIIADLGISYAQAGLFFTCLSLGSLFGTSLGGMASDRVDRRILFALIALLMAAGLAAVGLAPAYGWMLLFVFLLSVVGGPAGTVGQSIMLNLFPERRGRYLALQTLFSSLGSFVAPLLVAVNFAAGLSWRWPFRETAGIALALFLAVLLVPLQPARHSGSAPRPFRALLGNPRLALTAVLILLSVGPDLGFSFWLAEHFRTELKVSLRLSSAVVSLFLVGMMAGRLLTSRLLRRLAPPKILQAALVLALAAMAVFLLAPPVPLKLLAIVLYGLGVAPVFPLLMARGTATFPDQPGAVSGLLFACVSLGGMIFPFLLGLVAEAADIRSAYLVTAGIQLLMLVAINRFPAREPEAA